MSFKLIKLIFNVFAIAFVVFSFALLVFNSIKVDIRWYGISTRLNLYNGQEEKSKILVDSLYRKASGYDIAFGKNGYNGSVLNQFIIILLGIGSVVLLLRFVFSFIEKFNTINVLLGLIAGWGLLIVGILIWFFPLFARFSNEILSIIKEKDTSGYEVIVTKTMTPTIFFAGLLTVFSGLASLVSIHLRFD